MYKRILVPLDGSPLAEAALSHAEGLAQQFGSEVVLLRVVVSPYAIVAPDLVLAGYDSNHQQYVDHDGKGQRGFGAGILEPLTVRLINPASSGILKLSGITSHKNSPLI